MGWNNFWTKQEDQMQKMDKVKFWPFFATNGRSQDGVRIVIEDRNSHSEWI